MFIGCNYPEVLRKYMGSFKTFLVGGLVAIFIFPYIGFLIIPIDFHIFQRGGPTTNQVCFNQTEQTPAFSLRFQILSHSLHPFTVYCARPAGTGPAVPDLGHHHAEGEASLRWAPGTGLDGFGWLDRS